MPSMFDLLQNTQQMGMMQGQGTQVPVNPIARAIRSVNQGLMFQRAMAEEQAMQERAKQAFESEQKMQQEQIKASQLQQKAMQQEIDIAEKQAQMIEKRNNTTFSQALSFMGADSAFISSLPEGMADTKLGDAEWAIEPITQRLLQMTDPARSLSLYGMLQDLVKSGAPKSMLEDFASKSMGFFSKESVDAAWEAHNISPEQLLATIKTAKELQQGLIVELGVKAGRIKDLEDKLGKEKDAGKKADIQAKLDNERALFNSLPDMLMQQFEGSPYEITLKGLLEGMIFDKDVISSFPELSGMLSAREKVAEAKYLLKSGIYGGGGGGGRGGGSGKPKDSKFSWTRFQQLLELGDPNLANIELNKLYGDYGQSLGRPYTPEELEQIRLKNWKPSTPKTSDDSGGLDVFNALMRGVKSEG